MKIKNQTSFLLKILLGAFVVVICAESSWAVAGHWRRVARRTTVVVASSEAAASSSASQQQAAAANQSAAEANQAAASANQAAASANQAAAAASQPAPAPAQPAAAPAPAGAPPIGAVVQALPTGCVTTPKDGIEYYNCGGVFYRSTFQGNNLVYVVVQQP